MPPSGMFRILGGVHGMLRVAVVWWLGIGFPAGLLVRAKRFLWDSQMRLFYGTPECVPFLGLPNA
jgi:hypothetical protein